MPLFAKRTILTIFSAILVFGVSSSYFHISSEYVPSPSGRLLLNEVSFIKSEPLHDQTTKTSGFPSSEVDLIYTLINEYRNANGLSSLSVNSQLVESADLKNQQLYSTQTFSHSVNGESVWQTFSSVGYPFSAAGENLAEGFFDGPSTVQAWKNSPGHNANLLNSYYSEMGVSAQCGINMPDYPDTCLITLHLGSR